MQMCLEHQFDQNFYCRIKVTAKVTYRQISLLSNINLKTHLKIPDYLSKVDICIKSEEISNIPEIENSQQRDGWTATVKENISITFVLIDLQW